jgi:hypothetical protein
MVCALNIVVSGKRSRIGVTFYWIIWRLRRLSIVIYRDRSRVISQEFRNDTSLAFGITFLAWKARSFIVATDLATVAAIACRQGSFPSP